MPITWLGFTDFVSKQVAAVQSAANAAVDASLGSITLAFSQAVSAVALWLQAEVVQTVALTRASTSKGSDLDSWLADWTVRRTGATASAGNVTFGRYTATNQSTIRVGAVVSTGPGGQQFAVLADTSNTAYDQTQGAYILTPGVTSLTVPVQAVIAGITGNVLTGTVVSFVTPVTGVDTVTNAAALVGGSDQSSDDAARSMFADFIRGLPRGTPAAIGYAVRSVAPSASFAIAENTDTSGAYRPGWFVVTVDDGSGNPPQTLLNTIATQVQAYRAMGTFAAVMPPVVQSVVVIMNVAVDAGIDLNATIAGVVTAVTAYVNALPVGEILPFLRVAQVAFDASPHVTSVQHLSINGDIWDIDPGQFGVIKVGSIAVTPVPQA